jgi:hypothetical protein
VPVGTWRALPYHERVAKTVSDISEPHAGIQEENAIPTGLVEPFHSEVRSEPNLENAKVPRFKRTAVGRARKNRQGSSQDGLVWRAFEPLVLGKSMDSVLPKSLLFEIWQAARHPAHERICIRTTLITTARRQAGMSAVIAVESNGNLSQVVRALKALASGTDPLHCGNG